MASVRRLSGSAEYAKYLLDARQKYVKGHAATIKQVGDVYRRAAEGIRADILTLTPGPLWELQHEHLTVLQASLDARAAEMSKDILAATHQGIWMASAAGSEGVADVTTHMFADAFTERNVKRLFAGVNERATLAMLARTRRDGLKISDRVWRTSEKARNNVRIIVENAIARGQDARTTATQVQRYLRPGVWTAHKMDVQKRLGISERDISYEAMRLARTEMNNAFHEGMVAANQHSPGYRGIYWRLSGGRDMPIPDVCDDMAADMSHGESGFYPKGKEPVRPHPQCVAGGTVVSGPRVVGSTTRWYEGEVVELRTVGGHNLTVTPNHPILTSKGWVAAGLLREGSSIVCCEEDLDQALTIEDVASSLEEASTVPVSAEDFHGDGFGSQVCVVREKGEVSIPPYDAGFPFFSSLIWIRRNPRFAGHVYNLQTTEGWYSANGIVVHNCMCYGVPAYENPEEFAARLRGWMQDPRSDAGMEKWYNEDARRFMGRPMTVF